MCVLADVAREDTPGRTRCWLSVSSWLGRPGAYGIAVARARGRSGPCHVGQMGIPVPLSCSNWRTNLCTPSHAAASGSSRRPSCE